MTQQRNRVDRVAERDCRYLLECAADGLVDTGRMDFKCSTRLENILEGGCRANMPDATDEEVAMADNMLCVNVETQLYDRNAETMRAFLQSDAVRDMWLRYPRTLDDQLRGAFAFDCGLGYIAGVRFWLEHYDANAHCVGHGSQHDDVPVIGTPLYFAAAHGKIDVMRVLLEHGANPHAAASDGTTPFFMACANEHLPAMALLRDCHVDMSAPNEDGTSPSLIAANYCNLDV